MATKQCPSCHQFFEDRDSLFCPWCGTELGATRRRPGETVPPAPAPPPGLAAPEPATQETPPPPVRVPIVPTPLPPEPSPAPSLSSSDRETEIKTWVDEVFAPLPGDVQPEQPLPFEPPPPPKRSWLGAIVGGVVALAFVVAFIVLLVTHAAPATTATPPATSSGGKQLKEIQFSPDAWSPDIRYSDANGRQQLLVYFIKDRAVQPVKLPLVESAPKMGTAALTALLAGPTAAEKAEGLSTAIASGLGIKNLCYDVRQGVAFFTATGDLKQGKKAIPYGPALAQLVFTLTQFPWITYVQFRDEQGLTVSIDTPKGEKQRVSRDDLRGSSAWFTPPDVARQPSAQAELTATVPMATAQPSGGQPATPSKFTVTVQQTPAAKVAIDVAPSDVGEAGPVWQACSWAGPISAASVLGLKLFDYTVSYKVSGTLDGPGAGGLMTVGTMAALLGDTLVPYATLTGTVNPDQSLGPVSGIPQKLDALAKAGIKVLLVPAGETTDLDPKSNDWVDLAQRAQDLGIQLQPVADVNEAYTYLTGKRLDLPIEPAFSSVFTKDGGQALAAITKARTDAAQGYLQKYAGLADTAKDDYTKKLIDSAQKAAADSAAHLKQGESAAAYGSAKDAEHDAALAWSWGVAKGGTLDPEQAVSTADRDAFSAKLQAVTPQTVGEADCLIEAWGQFALAQNMIESVKELLTTAAGGTSQAAGNLAVFDFTTAIVAWDAANDAVNLLPAAKGAPIADVALVGVMAEEYRLAARANRDLIDSLVVPRFAAAKSASPEDAKLLLSMYDEYYERTLACLAQLETMRAGMPAGTARDYALLGTAVAGYICSSLVLAQEASYSAQYDTAGSISGFLYDDALTKGLETAQSHAEAAITAVDQTGEATIVPRLWEALGSLDRDGGSGYKMRALYEFWMASTQARMLRDLSGAVSPVVSVEDF